MAFLSAQNKLIFSGSETSLSYNLKLIRLVYKTLNEALTKEAAVHNRAGNYWVIDPSRSTSGNLPLEEGGSDLNIFQYGYNLTDTAKSGNYGIFLKSVDNEELFLSVSRQYSVGTSYVSQTYGMIINPINPSSIGSNDTGYTDNSHIYSGETGSYIYI